MNPWNDLSRTEMSWSFKLDPIGSHTSLAPTASHTARASAHKSNGGYDLLNSNRSTITSGLRAVPQ